MNSKKFMVSGIQKWIWLRFGIINSINKHSLHTQYEF